MKKTTVIGGVGLFVLGFMLSSLIQAEAVRYPFSDNNMAVASPSDSISQDNVHLYKDKMIIEESGLIYAKVKDTHSMEPLLNVHSTSIEKKPTTPDVLAVGDIVSYSLDTKYIIHRIVELGQDEQGWFAITKGDNNDNIDKEKVRFSQIEGKVVGILY